MDVVPFMRLAIEQERRERIGELTRAALEKRRAAGLLVGHQPPYGWSAEPNGRLVPNAKEREALMFAAEHRYRLGCTWHDTATATNKAGYRNRAGNTWTLHNLRSNLLSARKRGEI